MKKIYLANGLFSEADYNYNQLIEKDLNGIGYTEDTLYVPQNNKSINDKSKCANSVAIYDGDTSKLNWCDIIVAVIDGPVIDAGVASEIGWIAGWNNANLNNPKLILGLCTDSRDGHKTHLVAKDDLLASDFCESQYPYQNLYTIGAIKKYGKIFGTRSELIQYIKAIINSVR